jgi:glycosyltransferase involved in cell wall biosynthesis
LHRRILLLITDLEIGGTPSVVRELAVRLHDPPGVVVDVACLSAWGPTADQIQERGIRVIPLNARGTSDIGVLFRLSASLYEGRYDTVFSFLIHANTVAAAMKLVHRDVRFIQSIQTTQPEPRWHWFMQRLVQGAAEKIVVPSKSAKEVAMLWADIPPEKIVVISNAIDPDQFPRSVLAMRQPKPFPIGFIGRLDPIKQVPLLIQEFSLLSRKRDVILHIFGDGNDRHCVMTEIARFGLEKKVILDGVIAKPQAALERIGVLILPSAAEGFGLVLIEAMAAGVPVIANDAPGIRDVVREGETGLLINVADNNELSNAMQRLIDDQPLRLRLIKNGLAEARQRFSWQAILPAYRRLLNL